MEYILIVWLWGSASNAPPVVVAHYDTFLACDQAGKVWEKSQVTDPNFGYEHEHHTCLPHQ